MERWPLGVFASIDAGLGVELQVAHELGVPTIQLHAPQKATRTSQHAEEFLAQLSELQRHPVANAPGTSFISRDSTAFSNLDSAGTYTDKSVVTRLWQACLRPCSYSSSESFGVLLVSTCPFSIKTLHVPQVPLPPQAALI